jgi:hypothetical protein
VLESIYLSYEYGWNYQQLLSIERANEDRDEDEEPVKKNKLKV